MSGQSADRKSDSAEVLRFRDAYERLLPEIKAVEEPLVQVNVEIPVAVTTVLGALPDIRALRPRIEWELPRFDIARFDKLEALTLALAHAHTLYMAASAPLESLPDLSTKCMRLRELLGSDAQALALRGLLDGSRLKDLKGTTGYRQVAFDVFALSQILRENWGRIEGKTAVTLAELNQAEQLADRLATAVGERDQGPTAVGPAAEIRERTFTLFIRAYKDARRAAAYLVEAEIERFVPTIYIGVKAPKKRPEDEQPVAPAPTAGVVEAFVNGQPTEPRPQPNNGIPVGMRGSSPFSE